MYFEEKNNGYILRVRVTPNSSKCLATGIFTDSENKDFLKVNLCTVPEKGKANLELIKYLSKALNQSKSSFTIISGKTDRMKKIFLETEPSEHITEILHQLENLK